MCLISIIIPHFNRSLLLKETLASVVAQTYTDWEVIIVDDDSEEEEWKKIQCYVTDKINIIKRNELPGGPSKCRNIGIKEAKGEYLIFLDADDLLAPFCIEQRLDVMLQNTELDWAVFPQYMFFDNKISDSILFSKPTSTKEEAIAYFLQMSAPWQTMASIWKNQTLQILGGFDEQLRCMEDPDLHLRALLNTDIKLALQFDLQPDSYYRRNNLSGIQLEKFYEDSIYYRFQFIYKYVPILENIKEKVKADIYLKELTLGYDNFLKGFLLGRIRPYYKDFKAMNHFLKIHNMLQKKKLVFIGMAGYIYNSDSAIIRKLRLRGLVSKFFAKEKS
jgi:glycosyltransferase involved in cell wall biosynthesis